jgi:NADH-quinone oxidoreductase subunit L
MRRMGGLARRLPRTAAAFAIGALSLAGIPPLAGFFSKEQILGETFAAGHAALWAVGLVTAGVTAYYITRAHVLTFGPGGVPARPEAGDPAPHDPPGIMLRPTAALAFLTVVGGAIGTLQIMGPLGRWLRPAVEAGAAANASAVPPNTPAGAAYWLPLAAGVVVSIAGLVLGWLVYARRTIRGQAPALGTVLAHRFYVEEVYEAAIVAPTRALAGWTAAFDRGVIDRAVLGVAEGLGRGGAALRRLQSGYLRQYAAFVLIGALLILAYWMWRP